MNKRWSDKPDIPGDIKKFNEAREKELEGYLGAGVYAEGFGPMDDTELFRYREDPETFHEMDINHPPDESHWRSGNLDSAHGDE